MKNDTKKDDNKREASGNTRQNDVTVKPKRAGNNCKEREYVNGKGEKRDIMDFLHGGILR